MDSRLRGNDEKELKIKTEKGSCIIMMLKPSLYSSVELIFLTCMTSFYDHIGLTQTGYQKRKILFSLSSFFMCISLCTLLSLTCPAYAVPVPITLQSSDQQAISQTLKNDEQELLSITQALNDQHLSPKSLRLLQDNVDDIMSHAKLIQNESSKKVDEMQSLMKMLETSTLQKNVIIEDEITAQKRKELNQSLSYAHGQAKQADLLMSQARNLATLLAQRRLETKAKGLMQRTLPLYSPLLWEHGVTSIQAGFTQIMTDCKKIGSALFSVLSTSTIMLSFVMNSVLTLITLGVIMTLIYRRVYCPIDPNTTNLFHRLLYALTRFTLMAVLPFLAVWSVALFLNKTFFLGQAFPFLMVLSALWGAYVIVSLLFSTRHPQKRLIPVPNFAAKRLACLTYLFACLVILNAFFMAIRLHFPLPFTVSTEFILRTMAVLMGLFLLNKKTGLLSYIAPIQSLHYKTQQQILRYIRYTATFIFITNPVFVFCGYSQLAHFLFMNFLLSALFLMIELFLHMLCYEGLSRLIGKDEKNTSDTTVLLSSRDKELLHYWLLVGCDLILMITGLIGILLIWGLDRQDLIRGIKTLFLGFTIAGYHFSLIAIFLSLLLFASFFFVTRLIQHVLNKRIFPYTHLDLGVKNALHQGVGYIGLTLGFLMAIGMIGINLKSLALIAGALSVGIGFGLQNIVSNFIAGIIVLIERPVKLGDRIIIGQDEGVVRRISVRATELEASDGSSIIVPNGELISGRVRNWTFRNPLTKVDILVGVAYDSDTQKVTNLLLEAARAHPRVLTEPAPTVYFMNFGPSSLDFRLNVCVDQIEFRASVNSELHYAINTLFSEQGITIPFPQCEVHLLPPSNTNLSKNT